MDKSYPSREGLLLRSAATQIQTENKSAATTSSSASPDFVLQWGNRKRLRCMKYSKSDRNSNKNEPPGSDTPVRQTNRTDRRPVRSDLTKDSSIITNVSNVAANSTNGGNGYFNLRQRPASPSNRLLRNSESMRGQSNGGSGVNVKGLASPDRGVVVAQKHNNNNNVNNHHESNGNNVKCNKNNDIINNNNNNRSPSSETPSGSGDAILPAVWHPKFAICLTNKEKEEDFWVLKGSKLPQRPKKRNKFIQRTVNLISPGAWLCDLSLERYEVREKKVTKKRPRGLKAMGSVESDSE